jgi:hypothetical protein
MRPESVFPYKLTEAFLTMPEIKQAKKKVRQSTTAT